MKRTPSLRLRITLTCTALLALCCILITLTNNLSAVQMADSIQATPFCPPKAWRRSWKASRKCLCRN